MADSAKDKLLLGGGICHITATQAEAKKFLLAYVIFWVNFRQYFVCLRERIFNYCNVLMLVEVKVRDRIAVVISEIVDAIF